MAKKPKTNTRSYTLGLLSTSEANDWLPLWNRLFQTHYAVCRGAREYGEFYLNLRGGLAASLADCADEPDTERRRLLQRGARRMLALGWLSVESVRGAEDHPHRIRERVCEACGSLPQPSCERNHPDKVGELKPGQSSPPDLARRLLREILSTRKNVSDEAALAEWAGDCVLAMTANIRADAVIINRAAAFAEWQTSVGESGAEMPEQARRILFAMCGDGFASLTLPEEEAVKQEAEQAESDLLDADDPDDVDAKKSKSETEEAAEPSNASRGVYCDLFGGDPGPKIKREGEKIRFAAMLHEFLSSFGTGKQVCVFLDRKNLELGESPSRCDPARPLSDQLREWRRQHGWDWKNGDLLPREASPDNKKNKIAVPYRKLLVAAGLWPESRDEGGAVTPQHEKAGNGVQKKLKEVGITTAESAGTLGLVKGIVDACAKRATQEDLRVFKPAWAKNVQDSFERAARVGAIKGAPEFRYLMFALAARRISQTQTWTKRNEAERHKAAVKEDAAKKKLEELDPDGSARAWFSAYEEKRGEDSQASSDFRITRRMIGECDEVFKAWQGTESDDDREKKTASVQAKAEKFGDARLYADLSEDPAAAIIWQHEQGPELLKQWVKLRQAQHDQRRFKIPRFCHPSPFHHPTWCEFGGSSKPKVWYAWKADTKPQSPEPGGDADGSRRLWMLLPDFTARQAKAVPMRWRSKRLSQDLGGVRGHTEVSVPRADRLSLAAAKLPLLDANNEPIRYRPEYPFTEDAKGWNARLQLDRDTLEHLEKYWDDAQRTWRDDGKALRQARWFVTFAPALAASDGPGRDIHPKLGWKSSPHSELNKKQKREGQAQLILSRLPGLRVLSVDLGHRFAASCAVWETLSLAALKGEIKDRTIVSGGPGEQHLYLHTRHTDPKSKKERTTIYRRIGSDRLPGGKDHPAPWARLDRQFLIKLQGEERPARAASNKPEHGINEAALVASMTQELGHLRDDADDTGIRGVDELMRRAMRIATLGLKRHGRMAKIAYALNPECSGIPRTGGELKVITRGDDEHIKFLTNAFADWHALATDTEWDGSAARKLWNEHVKPLQSGFELSEPTPPDPNAERPTRRQRRKSEEELRERLKPIAEHFATATPEVAGAIHREWAKLWAENDGIERKSDSDPVKSDFVHTLIRDGNGKVIGSRTAPRKGKEVAGGWHSRLRLLTDWIMGWHLPGAQSKHWNRNVGGLSLTRIATMRSLYQLHKAFDMRPRPEKIQGAPRFGESNTGIAQSILDAMERMREQRVKQIASRIAASALGLGGHWKEVERRDHKGKPLLGTDGKPRMKRVWVEEPSPKYPTCHAVVIENLRNYRPDELQTRRENKALMSWSAGKVRKYLEEACQLHGLHLREVMPNYTSRQCSRTGLPGMRCADVPINDFLKSRYWVKIVASASKRLADKGTDSLDTMIRDLHDLWSKAPDDAKKKQCTLRIPKPGADLFVAALTDKQLANHDRMCKSQDCPTCTILSRATQADLNAAANIGLRALLDPDFMGKWWYIPCESATGKPAKEKCAGAACLEHDREYLAPQRSKLDDGSAKKKSKSGERTNAWRDLDSSGDWLVHGAYWNFVKARIVKQLRAANGLESADSHS